MLSTDLLAFYRGLDQRDLTIVDLETTGFAPPMARAIEISILQASYRGGIQRQVTHLINPGVPIPEKITRLTGISPAMVATAEPADMVWPQCFPLLTQGIFTAHNVSFDYPFVQAELRLQGFEFGVPPTQRFCSVIFSRLMLPDLPSRSLPKLVEHFQFNVGQSHRAEADTLACWMLIEELLHQLSNTEDEVLLQRFGRQWLTLRDIVEIFGQRQSIVQRHLQSAGLQPRISSRTQTIMYQRSAVERVFWEVKGQQGSLLDEI
jgi:DNA polymerase III subunit epsilon